LPYLAKIVVFWIAVCAAIWSGCAREKRPVAQRIHERRVGAGVG
jgi:hypothetical protein